MDVFGIIFADKPYQDCLEIKDMPVFKRFLNILAISMLLFGFSCPGCANKTLPALQIGLKQPQFIILSVLDVKTKPNSPNPYQTTVKQPHSFAIDDHRQGYSTKNPGMIFNSTPNTISRADSPAYNRSTWPISHEPSGIVTHSDSVIYYEKFYSSEYDSGNGHPRNQFDRQIRGYRVIEQHR